MDWNKLLYPTDEKPLDKLVEGYSRTSIFRTIGFIGDSLSSGEFETRDSDGKAHYHDLYDYSWGQFIARMRSLEKILSNLTFASIGRTPSASRTPFSVRLTCAQPV